MKAFVIDTETSLHNTGDDKVGGFAANPHCPDNFVVWAGAGQVDPSSPTGLSQAHCAKSLSRDAQNMGPPATDTVLVGHNIKFDLLYLMQGASKNAGKWRQWVRNPAAQIWDTMVAQYRLEGQLNINPSLDRTCLARGLPLKPGRMKEYWKNGVSTEDIPDAEVEPYLQHDLSATAKVFLKQVTSAQSSGLLPFLREEMGALLTTTAAEYDGMKFDSKGAIDKLQTELIPRIEQAEITVLNLMNLLAVPKEAMKPGSAKLVHALLMGGSYKYETRSPLVDDDGEVSLFKSGARKGMPRFKVNKMEWLAPCLTTAPVKTTGIDDLEKIRDHKSTQPLAKDFIEALLLWRGLQKQASTYYTGYSKLTWPHDGRIHGQLNHTVTSTGRLSASAPNLQNAAHTDIREFFVSRIEGGRLAEVDLSQIEIVVQGILSGDAQMLADLHAGIDFHSKRAAKAAGQPYETVRRKYLAGDPYWTKKRKEAKIFSFQRAYGAGAPKIADYTGMTIKEVEALIAAEEALYPGVVSMQNGWIEQVKKSAQLVGDKVLGRLVSPTGVRYVFERETYKGKPSFRPTAIKNYMIQGTAGDLIKIILNRLRETMHKWMDHEYGPWFVMTVHDSLVFDLGTMDDGVAAKFISEILYVMTEVTQHVLKHTFNTDFQGLIKADAEIGKNWYDMKGFKP